MGFNFSKFNTPEWKEKQRKEEEERERKEALRKQTCCIVGVGPDKLGGYGFSHPEVTKLSSVLYEVLEYEIKDGITRFMTGGDLGTSQIAFLVVESLKQKYPGLKNILVLPFGQFGETWPTEQTMLLNRIGSIADEVIEVEDLAKYEVGTVAPNAPSLEKLKQREEFYADHCASVIGAYPIQDRGYDSASGILYKGRGMGMRHVWIHTDHNFSYDARWQS